MDEFIEMTMQTEEFIHKAQEVATDIMKKVCLKLNDISEGEKMALAKMACLLTTASLSRSGLVDQTKKEEMIEMLVWGQSIIYAGYMLGKYEDENTILAMLSPLDDKSFSEIFPQKH